MRQRGHISRKNLSLQKCDWWVSAAILVLLFASCTSQKQAYNPLRKLSAAQSQQDFAVLEKILHHNHPSLYWYASRDSVESAFKSTFQSLTDSLTEQQLRNKIAAAVTSIHCGHTTVRASKKAVSYFTKKKPLQFPLALKFWKDTALIIADASSDSASLKGKLLVAINGTSISTIRDSIFQLIGTDGYADIFKYQALTLNFAAFYRNVFGADSSYHITYLNNGLKQAVVSVKRETGKKDTSRKKMPTLPLPDKHQLRDIRLSEKRSLTIDTATSTAFINVNTFSEGKLIRFFRKSFRTIKQQQIKHLVVDVRQNTGGDVEASTTLLQYLCDHSFNVADSIVATSKSFVLKNHIKPWFFYWLSMQVSGRKDTNGQYHFRYFEKKIYKPKSNYHFSGDVYVLTGGYTFSAASLFAGKLKGQKNVTIAGEETGGGYYGNTAMFLTSIVLPNSGIRVTLPLYRMVWDKTRPKNGRGVFPDVWVQPTADQLRQGKDAKLEKVKDLIKTRNSL